MTERVCSRLDAHAEHDWTVEGDPFRIGVENQPCRCPGRAVDEVATLRQAREGWRFSDPAANRGMR